MSNLPTHLATPLEILTVDVIIAMFAVGTVRNEPVGNGRNVKQRLQCGVQVARVADVDHPGAGVPLAAGRLPTDLDVVAREKNSLRCRQLVFARARW